MDFRISWILWNTDRTINVQKENNIVEDNKDIAFHKIKDLTEISQLTTYHSHYHKKWWITHIVEIDLYKVMGFQFTATTEEC